MKYFFFNYDTCVMVVSTKEYCESVITDEEFDTLVENGKLDIRYRLWMRAIATV